MTESTSKAKADPHRLRRRSALGRAEKDARIDAYLITRPEDVGYFTGFTGEDSCAVFGRGWACLITDGRYAEQAREECGRIQVNVRSGPMAAAVGEALKGRRVRRVGVQGDHVTVRVMNSLREALGRRTILPLDDIPGALRATKDDREIRAIIKAVRVAERAFRELIAPGAAGLVGRTERDVAAELDYRMRRRGAAAPAFETIVAAGANSSKPHYSPGASRIRRDQAVLIDWGAKVDGYVSDLTRVVFTGRIPPKLREVYGVVARAQAAGIAAAVPGAACKTPDAAARAVIEAAGFARQFVHGLGHGIGRAVHELPVLGRQAATRLRKGMVVTVEPGIYLPGVGGIRIEDDILVGSAGRRLSTLGRTPGSMMLK